MKSEINALRQLQELVLTRDEHHQTLFAISDKAEILSGNFGLTVIFPNKYITYFPPL